MISEKYESYLEKYAELIVKVGLNIQPGQNLAIHTDSLGTAPLVKAVVKHAYLHQCNLVKVFWIERDLDLIKCQYANEDSLSESTYDQFDSVIHCLEQKYAHLIIGGGDPELFTGYDQDSAGMINKAFFIHLSSVITIRSRSAAQWTTVLYPTNSWAKRIFPDLDPEAIEQKIWEAVINACYLEQDNPAEYWKSYLEVQGKRARYLNKKQYEFLSFRGPGTDLQVGLSKGHNWTTVSSYAKNGVGFTAQFPGEEIFTAPHKTQINGFVSSSKPLYIFGDTVEDFVLRFSDGVVVDFSAKVGEDILGNILSTDDNSNRLGEVALVPHNNPVSQSGLLFKKTLYDEEASSHLALGNAYRQTVQGGLEMSDQEFEATGANQSKIHVDFMFGSQEIDVDGVLTDGTSEPVMKGGEWAFDV